MSPVSLLSPVRHHQASLVLATHSHDATHTKEPSSREFWEDPATQGHNQNGFWSLFKIHMLAAHSGPTESESQHLGGAGSGLGRVTHCSPPQGVHHHSCVTEHVLFLLLNTLPHTSGLKSLPTERMREREEGGREGGKSQSTHSTHSGKEQTFP